MADRCYTHVFGCRRLCRPSIICRRTVTQRRPHIPADPRCIHRVQIDPQVVTTQRQRDVTPSSAVNGDIKRPIDFHLHLATSADHRAGQLVDRAVHRVWQSELAPVRPPRDVKVNNGDTRVGSHDPDVALRKRHHRRGFPSQGFPNPDRPRGAEARNVGDPKGVYSANITTSGLPEMHTGAAADTPVRAKNGDGHAPDLIGIAQPGVVYACTPTALQAGRIGGPRNLPRL